MLASTWNRHGLWPSTSGMDAGYHDGHFLGMLGDEGIVLHVPMPNKPIRAVSPTAEVRRRARRRQRTKGYAISQCIRKRVEEVIGWCKGIGTLARARFVRRWKLKQQADVNGAAYNLVRLARLAPVV